MLGAVAEIFFTPTADREQSPVWCYCRAGKRRMATRESMVKVDTSIHEVNARLKFDQWSESSTFRRLGPWLRFVQEAVLAQISWNKVSRVLDVACGSGWAVHEAARRLGAGDRPAAYGCDISKGMLQQRASGGARSWFLVSSGQCLPFRTGSFDVVLCTAAFHHFSAPDKALVEFRRVLRPHGTVLIADTCRDQSPGTWIWDRLHRWFEKGHRMYYRRSELENLMRSVGFDSVRHTELRPSFAQTRKLVRRATLFCARKPNGSEA